MSTQIIKNQTEGAAPKQETPKITQSDAADALMTLSAGELLDALGVSSEENQDVANGISILMLEEEEEEIEKENDEEQAFIASLGAQAAGGSPTGEKAVFMSAGLTSLLQSKAQSSVTQELKNQLKMMEVELSAMENMEAFWEKFGSAWNAFKEDPSIANFLLLMTLLESHFGNNSAVETFLEDIETAGISAFGKEEQYQNASGWWRFWHGDWSDPKYWTNFTQAVTPALYGFEVAASGNPGLFQEFMQEGQQVFQDQIQKILLQIQDLSLLESILDGGKS